MSDRKTKNALTGAVVGGALGLGVGTLVSPGVGSVVGLGVGAGLGGLVGYNINNPTVIFDGKPYVIVIKHRDHQPKFKELHMRHVTDVEFVNLIEFFTKFHNDPSTTNINYCKDSGEYYFLCKDSGIEHALNKDTLDYVEYSTTPGDLANLSNTTHCAKPKAYKGGKTQNALIRAPLENESFDKISVRVRPGKNGKYFINMPPLK